MTDDPRIAAVPDIHGHAKGEHKLYVDERPIPYTARMLFLWFFHACRRGAPRFLMVADHINYLTFEDPAAVNLVRRALKLAQAGDLYGAAETAGVEVNHAAVVGDGLRRGMRYSIGAEVDNDPRSRPDAQNIVDAMRPDGMVRSVHFLSIKHPQFGENWMWPFDNPEFRELYDVVGTEQTWELYVATLLEAIDKLPGHIVGHFYVPGKFGHWPSDEILERYEDQLLEACAGRGMAVEINSRYFYKHAAGDDAQLEKYRAASLRLLRKAKDKGVMVAVGSDAHSPKDQGRAFAEVLALLDEAGINEIAFPIDGRLARVALRATDELRKASALAVRHARPESMPIPGVEEPESDDDDAAAPADATRNGAAAGYPSEQPAESSPAPAAAKKRPSRAKKPSLDPKAGIAAPAADKAVPAPGPAASHADASAGGVPGGEPVERRPVSESEAASVPYASAEAAPIADETPTAVAGGSVLDAADTTAAALPLLDGAPAEGESFAGGALPLASTGVAGDSPPIGTEARGDGRAADSSESAAATAGSGTADTFRAHEELATPAVPAAGEPPDERAPVERANTSTPAASAESVPAAIGRSVPEAPVAAGPVAGEPVGAEVIDGEAVTNETASDARASVPGPAAVVSDTATASSGTAAVAESPSAAPKPRPPVAPRAAETAAPAASPRRAAKPNVTAPAKSAARGKVAASGTKASGTAKKTSAKRTTAKKTARPARAAPAKKTAAKKAATARKAVTKSVAAKASARPGVKKAAAKKPTVKKKATKSRR